MSTGLRLVVLPVLLLASYAAIFGTLFAAAGSDAATWVAIAGWAATLACGLLLRKAWPEEPPASIIGVWALGAVLSVFIMYAGWLISYGVQISGELCGEGASATVALLLGAVAYAVVGTIFGRAPRALIWAWPTAVVAGLAVRLALLALLPGAHGFCET
jgi:hypothetical protein